MPFTTLGELQDAIASWTNRRNLTGTLPDFIRLAEARIRGDIRSRGMWSQAVHRATLNDAQQVNPYQPGTLASVEHVLFANTRLEAGTTAQFIDERLRKTRRFGIYTINAGRIRFTQFYDEDDTPTGDKEDVDIEVWGWEAPTFDYTDPSSTNDLLERWPNAWLWAALLEAATWLRDFEEIELYNGRLSEAMNIIEDETAQQSLPNNREVRGMESTNTRRPDYR